VTGDDSALGVNQHGVREAKLPDTAGDLGHLGLRMRPRVARVGDQSADIAIFDGEVSRAPAQALSDGKLSPTPPESAGCAGGVPESVWETCVGRRLTVGRSSVQSARSVLSADLGHRRAIKPMMTGIGVRREKAALSSGCKAHPAISFQPEAIGAVMEVTKWLKPSNSGHDLVTA
jgi:hypothetical protein